MMENYILSLIKENNRVIIPEFGAFIVAKENGISVLFNNFLSFNDGLLVDHIVDVENISKDDANAKVSEYVTMVKEALDSVGNYTIEGLGKFTKDTTGILRFEQADKISDPVLEKPIDKREADLLDISNDDTAEDQVIEDTSIKSSELNSTRLNDSTPIAEVEEEKPTPAPSKKTATTFKKTATAPPVKKDPVKVANKYIEEENKKRNRSITIFVVAFLLIPLLGFTIYFLFFKGDSPAETESKIALETVVKTEIKEELPKQDLGAIDAGPEVIENKKEDEEKTVEVPVNINKPHHLIVGSFSTEDNALKMISKIKAKGYEQCSFFEHNNRFLVSIESFAKVYEAQARQEEILGKERMESWIMTKRK